MIYFDIFVLELRGEKMVESIVNIITRKLVTDGIVAENDKEWFHYGLQKRFTSSISACVFFIIAVVLSNVCVACT